jgi:hypothetical protein
MYKTCDRNINQIKFPYEKRCIDLYSFYLEKDMYNKTLIKINIISENKTW